MRVHLCAVYSILILQHIGMGIAMIVSDEASHAFHFLQKSSQADDAKNLFHIYPGSEGIVIHQQPNSWERKIEKLFFFS